MELQETQDPVLAALDRIAAGQQRRARFSQ
jgi:hypothetical protein